MNSFGEFLRRERELRGVTLEEISKTSNIRIGYLKALERNDFESFPAEVFVKGFLRCYAESAGMDYNDVLLAYNSFISGKRAMRVASQRPLETPTKFNMNIKLLSFLVIVTFVIVPSLSLMVFFYAKKNSEIKPLSVPGEKISQEVDEISVEEIKSNISIFPDSNTTEKESNVQSEDMEAQPQGKEISDYLAPPPPIEKKETPITKKIKGRLVLSMEAKEDAWIAVVIDDTVEKEALLLPGETARWEAKEKFVVSLGNAAGTHLKLNEKDIILPKASSNVIRNYTITLDKINSPLQKEGAP